MARRFWFFALMLQAAACAAARPANAEVTPASASPERSRVRIVKIGNSDDWSALERALRQFLRPHGIEPSFESRAGVEQLDQGPGPIETVWIELVSAERARLILSDAAGARYLLRDVALVNGLDEVGRETLAQVIESSLSALQERGATLSRAEVERLLSPESNRAKAAASAPAVESGAPSTPSAQNDPKAPARATSPAAQAPARFSWRVAPSYVARYLGPELEIQHGLALGVALRHALGDGRLLGASVGWEEPWQLEHRSELLAISRKDRSGWLTIQLTLPLAASWQLVGEAGGGLVHSRIVPERVPDGRVSVGPSATSLSFWLRGELGLKWHGAGWSLQLSALTDVSTADTHYDVRRGETRRRWLTPWAVAPGLRAAIGWES